MRPVPRYRRRTFITAEGWAQLSCADGLLAFGRAVFFLSHFQPQNGPVASGAQTPVGGEF